MNQTGKAVGPRPVSGRTNPLPILQVTTGFWASQALMTAVELRIFTVLFGGPKTAADVAAEVGAEPVALEALLTRTAPWASSTAKAIGTGTTMSRTSSWSRGLRARTWISFAACGIRSTTSGRT
jgi:hypothetical protein